MPLSTECEVRAGAGWARMDIAEALERGKLVMRCPACHGAVRAHKRGTTGQAAHFEHHVAHPGCRFGSAHDRGAPSPHPLPVR